MKKVLTVLLAIAVVFTFSFGSTMAFAATDDVKDTVSALKDASVSLQGTIDSAAAAYKTALQTDDDGYVIAAKGGLTAGSEDLSGKISKTVMEARIDKVADDAKNAFDAEVKKVQNLIEKDGDQNSLNLELDASAAKAYVNAMFEGTKDGADGAVEFMTGITYDEIFADGTVVLGSKDYTGSDVAVVVNQYKADKDAVTDALNAYKADADKYSDNISDKKYKATTELVEEGTSTVTVLDENLGTVSGGLYKVEDLTGKTTEQSAREFVKNFVDYQLKVVDAIDSSAQHKELVAGIDALKNVKSLANDVMKGHKKTDSENYYVAAVPTKDETTGEGLTTDKNRAIRQVKAALNAAVVNIEKALDDELTAENKKSKPDTTKVKNLREALDDLNGQVAAAEEYITAVINYAESSDEVDAVKADLMNNTNTAGADFKVIGLKAVLDFSDSDDYADFTTANGAQDVLKALKKVSENVADLKKEADLLKVQLEVNGAEYFDQAVLADNLEDAIEDLYKTDTISLSGLKSELAAAKQSLWDGTEYTLVLNKYRYTEYIKGNEVSDWYPDDKNGNALKDKNNEQKYAWNKSDATRTVDASNDEVVAVMENYKVNDKADVVDLYDEAQADALKALVDETEKAIKEAKTVAEVKAIFVAAQAKYEDIPTTVDHLDDWAKSKPIGKEYDKQAYDSQLKEYINYVDAKVDFADDYYFANETDAKAAILAKARDIMFEAYSKDELAAKFDEAKAMIDKVPTKSEVKDAKKAVEDAINALPTTVALTDKDAIVKAADALDDYEDLLGDTKPSINNETKLVSAKTNYEKLAAAELDDAYRALKDKNITIDDEAAINALRDLHDAYWDYMEDYCEDDNIATTSLYADRDAYDAKVSALEDDLSDAKVLHARELMLKIPANPALANKADVEAARAYYDSLELKEQLQIVGKDYYKTFLDAEEALGLNTNLSVKELKITASSTAKKGSITVKWTVKGDASAVDGYEIWKSKKHSSGYSKAFTTKKQTYKNTKGLKKGTRYYYKVRAYKMVDGKKITSDWSNKARRIAK